jgi:hypothetical protein
VEPLKERLAPSDLPPRKARVMIPTRTRLRQSEAKKYARISP